MKHRLTSLILGATLGGAVLFAAPKEAHASLTHSGYVCTVRTNSEGAIYFSLYSGPECTGSFLKSFKVCPIGSEGCSAIEYSTSARDYLHEGLMQALAFNLRAEAYEAGIYPFYAFHYVTFRGD